MQKGKFVQIEEGLRCTHFFSYKDKKYPINIDFFNCYSQFFSNNLDVQQHTTIPLLLEEQERNIDLPEESIQNFINFVHRQQIFLTNENVVFLNYLANIYQVPLLINVTNDYISSNHNDFVLQLLILYQDDPNCKQEQFEDIISKSLLDYIDDDRLLSLDISMLYRIVDRYFVDKEKSNRFEENDKLMNFLFKCLKKFGRPASALFTHVNFTIEKAKYLNQLLFDHDVEFDFHFVSCSFYRSFYQRQNEILKKLEISQQRQDEIDKTRSEQERQSSEQKRNLKEEINKLRNELNQFKNEQTQKLNDLRKKYEDELSQSKIDETLQLKNLNKKHDDELNQLRNELNQSKTEQTSQLNDLKKKYEDELNQLKRTNEKLNSQVLELFESKQKIEKEIDKIKEEIANNNNNKSISCLSQNGILKNMANMGMVNLEVSRATHCSINNLFDNSLKTVFKFADKGSEPGYILFDFQNKKINLTKYRLSIPSKESGCWCDRPKSWKILGSNNKSKWDLIDLRENVTSLNDFSASNEFFCNKISSNYYQFIKIEIIISLDNTHEFLLAEIEFFGSCTT